jgi:hypothetical protein
MKRLDKGGRNGKYRVIVTIRESGKPTRNRSEMLFLEKDEIPPSLDDALEAAANAILRLSKQNVTYGVK